MLEDYPDLLTKKQAQDIPKPLILPQKDPGESLHRGSLAALQGFEP